ncbi:hypothetical protein ES703_95919 [subsurface metagenome]
MDFTYIRVDLLGSFAIHQSAVVVLDFIVAFGGTDMRIQMVGLEFTGFNVCPDCLCKLFHNLVNPAEIEIVFERPRV